MFWACNGQEIRHACELQYMADDRRVYLWIADGRRVRVEIVDRPNNRCPHCGEKIDEEAERNNRRARKTE